MVHTFVADALITVGFVASLRSLVIFGMFDRVVAMIVSQVCMTLKPITIDSRTGVRACVSQPTAFLRMKVGEVRHFVY